MAAARATEAAKLAAWAALVSALFLSPWLVSGQQRAINIDGAWSPWSTISTPCLRQTSTGLKEVTCGGGKQTKVRSCTNPRPQVMTAS